METIMHSDKRKREKDLGESEVLMRFRFVHRCRQRVANVEPIDASGWRAVGVGVEPI